VPEGRLSMGVLDNMKDVADLIKKAGDIELYKKIVAAEDEVRELTRENRRLEDRALELEEAVRFKDAIEFKAPFYYLKEGDQTPFCPSCWEEKEKRPVHVVLIFGHEGGRSRWDCPVCKNTFMVGKGTGQGQLVPRVQRYT